MLFSASFNPVCITLLSMYLSLSGHTRNILPHYHTHNSTYVVQIIISHVLFHSYGIWHCRYVYVEDVFIIYIFLYHFDRSLFSVC